MSSMLQHIRKQLRGLPLILAFSLGVPGLIAGQLWWFTQHWADALFITCVLVMWTGQVSFVHPERRRGQQITTRLLIFASFLIGIGVSVGDRIYNDTLTHAALWSYGGLALCLLAIPIGIRARLDLGKFYIPDPTILPGQTLVTQGVYRHLRHPMYTAGFLWMLGLAGIVRSLWGSVAILICVGIAFRIRIRGEEALLLDAFGDEYRRYQARTWRLLPFIF